MRLAVTNTRQDIVARYLPDNYVAVEDDGRTLIIGRDVMGWTLDDYVIPRLASGLHTAVEISVPPCFTPDDS